MRIPLSTYRLQFTPAFGFKEANVVIPYLAELGVSDVYASPIFKARHNSSHGYDVVDPNLLNDELGTPEEFKALRSTVARHGLGWVQDIVPNHMAFSSQNHMLMDVVEYGQDSPFQAFFDIDWDHPYEGLHGRLLAPFLGKFYAQALNDAEVLLCYDEGGLYIKYYDFRFPVSLRSYKPVLMRDLGRLEKTLGAGGARLIGFVGTVDLLKPPAAGDDPGRFDQITHAKRMLWKVYTSDNEIRTYIDENLAACNGRKGEPETQNDLDDLLSRQHFRLSFWKVASEELNYRRFFSVNDLIAVRVENEPVFLRTHDFVLRCADSGTFSGLRIDHIDGLYDPAQYLDRLRRRLPETYMVVEKILGREEQLPPWPVQGTTGYDFLNSVNGLFCKPDNAASMTRIYAKFTGGREALKQIAYRGKREIIQRHMGGDIDNLAYIMKRVASNHRYGRDITLYGLRAALVEVLAFFPVYRTYVNGWNLGDADSASVTRAVGAARSQVPALVYELDFIESFLLLHFEEPLTEKEKDLLLHFVMRFQQFTGPLMAKGLEDTVFYVYNRLLSLNEVGGDPSAWGVSADEFHAFNTERRASLPHGLSATATHDTKRGEDARARINVLSEMPQEWATRVALWSRLNRRKKRVTLRGRAPDANDEWLLYQTLIGSWPVEEADLGGFLERMKAFALKAVREAKVHTEWIKPDSEYEDACEAFVTALLSPADNPFLADFVPFCKSVSFYGMVNSLSQTLLKITSPGVPDVYQGCELWDWSLVDPDNRRPVDFALRESLLRDIKHRAAQDPTALAGDLLEHKQDGRVKMFLIHRALMFRNHHADLFNEGTYLPLATEGSLAGNVIAFARQQGNEWAVTAVPRLLVSVAKNEIELMQAETWHDTAVVLPANAPAKWNDALLAGEIMSQNGRLMVGDLLAHFPVGLVAT